MTTGLGLIHRVCTELKGFPRKSYPLGVCERLPASSLFRRKGLARFDLPVRFVPSPITTRNTTSKKRSPLQIFRFCPSHPTKSFEKRLRFQGQARFVYCPSIIMGFFDLHSSGSNCWVTIFRAKQPGVKCSKRLCLGRVCLLIRMRHFRNVLP